MSIEHLKEQLEAAKRDLDNGRLMGVHFVGGPSDGKKLCMFFENGEPVNLNPWIATPSVINKSEPNEWGRYRWDFEEGLFKYDHETKIAMMEEVCKNE